MKEEEQRTSRLRNSEDLGRRRKRLQAGFLIVLATSVTFSLLVLFLRLSDASWSRGKILIDLDRLQKLAAAKNAVIAMKVVAGKRY